MRSPRLRVLLGLVLLSSFVPAALARRAPAPVAPPGNPFPPYTGPAAPLAAPPQGGFSIGVDQLIGGQVTTFQIDGASAGGFVGVAASTVGPGPTPLLVTGCGLIFINLFFPNTIKVGFAPPGGSFSFSVTVPPQATGLTVWIQGLDAGSCSTSNTINAVFG